MTPREILKRYLLPQLKRQLGVGIENFMIPLIMGPTQCGKTQLARELAAELNCGLMVMLMQTEDPTDITGMVKAVQGEFGHVVSKLNPYWYQTYLDLEAEYGSVLLFFDEIDKMPSDCIASILTLIRNRTINGTLLENAMMISAANEFNLIDEWQPEMRARVRVVTMDYDWEWEIDHMPYHVKEILKARINDAILVKPKALPKNYNETPSTWWNFARDLLDYGNDETLMDMSCQIFHPNVATFIKTYIHRQSLGIQQDIEAFKDEKIRNQFAQLVMNRQLTPESAADMGLRVLKYLLKDPFPKENTEEWKAIQRGVFSILVKITTSSLFADVQYGDKSYRHTGTFTKNLLDNLTPLEMHRVAIDSQEYAKYGRHVGYDDTGVPHILEMYTQLENNA